MNVTIVFRAVSKDHADDTFTMLHMSSSADILEILQAKSNSGQGLLLVKTCPIVEILSELGYSGQVLREASRRIHCRANPTSLQIFHIGADSLIVLSMIVTANALEPAHGAL
ncbi:unnamed protein product [Caenorhabditis sp. 36 PRJEB53466]|nr:unnamed protein product [Caenorhabditis sp. 36 PRJEB53466]